MKMKRRRNGNEIEMGMKRKQNEMKQKWNNVKSPFQTMIESSNDRSTKAECNLITDAYSNNNNGSVLQM